MVLEEKILKFCNEFFAIFFIIFPLERAGPLFEQTFPLPKDALCQVKLKLVHWFWRRRYLNFINVFSHLPMEKEMALNFYKIESP